MDTTSVTFSFFLVFSGAAVLASVALYTRQPLLIAYIGLGALLGPYGFGLITDLELLRDFAHIGIIFLLFSGQTPTQSTPLKPRSTPSCFQTGSRRDQSCPAMTTQMPPGTAMGDLPIRDIVSPLSHHT